MRILYICTGNSFRSPVAEALTRKHHDMEVESAGVSAVDFVSPAARDWLKKRDALKYVKPDPDQISQRAIEEADKVVCMMPRHSEYIKRNFNVDPDKVEVWKVEDPIHPGKEPEEAFKEIEEKVRGL
ncbi:MAG: hypothetical protein ACLFRK_02185 [Candidatus Nanohaloarchaea archaeon]